MTLLGSPRAGRFRRASVLGLDAVGTAGVAVVILLVSLRPLSVALPGAGLDDSWITVLGEKAEASARWGVDVSFTYGPLSQLVTRYLTASYIGTVMPVAVAVAVTVGLCIMRALATAGAGGMRGLAFAALATVCFAGIHLDQDPIYFSLALLCAFLDLTRSALDRVTLAAVVGAALLMGVASLAKTSFGVAALPLFVLSDLRSAFRRRPPLLVPSFLVGAAGAFSIYGQHVADLPAFLALQWGAASGYGEAMYVVGSRSELLAYLLGAAALLAATAALSGAIDRPSRACALAGLAIVLLIGLKAGFVRQDSHPQIAWQTLALSGLFSAVTLILPTSSLRAAALGTASSAVLWLVAPLFSLREANLPVSLDGLAGVYGETAHDAFGEVGNWARWLEAPGAFAEARGAEKAEAWRRTAAAHPLPALIGTVDMLPSEQGAVLANGLAYRSRPSFQEYGTYSASLIAANASFYASPSAPDWVIFGTGGLDERYPNTTEGALWPTLLQSYEPVLAFGEDVALHRRATPLPDVLGAAGPVTARLDESVALPGTGPVFSRIVVRQTLLGRLAALLFRPPALAMEVKFVDGHQEVFRFIPAIAEAGFVLSPMVENGQDFASLGFGWPDPGRSVAAFTVSGTRAARLFYEGEMEVDFRPLRIAGAEPGAEGRALYESLKGRQPWKAMVSKLGLTRVFSNGHLSAQPPNTIPVEVEGARRVHLAFGIEDGAWTTGHTQGVCFALRGQGFGTPLWQRCLDPATSPTDRGEQSAEVAFPPGLTAMRAETSCPRTCDWGWSYWSDMRLEP